MAGSAGMAAEVSVPGPILLAEHAQSKSPSMAMPARLRSRFMTPFPLSELATRRDIAAWQWHARAHRCAVMMGPWIPCCQLRTPDAAGGSEHKAAQLVAMAT